MTRYSTGWCSGYKCYTLHSEKAFIGYYDTRNKLNEAIENRLTQNPKSTMNGKTLEEFKEGLV